MAKANVIPYEPRECDYEGDCSGTCPFCEKEAANLLAALKEKERQGLEIKADEYSIMLLEKGKMDFDDAYEAFASELERREEMLKTVGRIHREEDTELQRRQQEEMERIMKGNSFYNKRIRPLIYRLFGQKYTGLIDEE